MLSEQRLAASRLGTTSLCVSETEMSSKLRETEDGRREERELRRLVLPSLPKKGNATTAAPAASADLPEPSLLPGMVFERFVGPACIISNTSTTQ